MAKRKIYDIKPPKVSKKVEEGIKEFLGDDKKHARHNASALGRKKIYKKEGRPVWLPVLVGTFAVLLVVCVYLFFKLPKADIQIWPKVDILSFKQTITADKSADSIDETKFVIPAQYFEVSKTVTQDFPATGSSDDSGKASGTITVYNKSNIPYLKSGTRFVSDSGKLFLATTKVILPAPKKSGSKITPSTVQVKVEAAEGGDSFNIAPANFSVPGLKGTADYYNIYGVSTSAMAGGYAGKIKKVTDDDIQGAKDALVKKATDDSVSAVKSQISSDYVLLDNAVSSTTVDASTQTKAGAALESFSYQATVKTGALAFKKSDIENFAKQYIASQQTDGKTLLDSSFKINYSASSVDVSGGKATLNLDFSSGVYEYVNKDSTALSLMGKSASQIDDAISNMMGDQVSKVKINLWPFWVKRAPDSQKAVKIELMFN